STTPITIIDNQHKSGSYYGFYLQDEWTVFPALTVNFGGRFDVVDEYAHANQFSPRVNVVLTATSSTTLHIGYARYFTPPPPELVQAESISKFNGTSGQPAVTESSPVKPERAHYFDAGLTQRFGRSLSFSVDAYYKAAKDLIDEGQFGAAVIFSPF